MRCRLRSDEGSFTLEASMVLPIILCITMLLLFFCLYAYQKSMLLQVAANASEQAAFNWDNSHKARDGAAPAGEFDSLYWRIGDDRLLSSLFGLGSSENAAGITLPPAAGDGSLPEVKLGNATARIPGEMTGEMNYSYSISGRAVSTRLSKMLRLPVIDGVLSDGAQPEADSRSLIVEPVEFIRTVDLMRYYDAKFRGASGESGMKRDDASEMVKKLGKK
ncbi:pilus assembly protein [Paenibacillus sp. HN-1]|uniref:TadE/TadG family type IV pilus assembly protein n=1 Tax=Paenibacillus TaxID=44249 RepID=UPI001CA88D2E|nr:MULTISPECIES: TadE/TadG family type IV pilus assembly protein [Paenibacillus]MBY9080958.1 pilus assembly protein [Paenibacillus sp. CGMCC 1.18879]MBY9085050.1 pilus assembly protein [Paenibacillus sinensis]